MATILPRGVVRWATPAYNLRVDVRHLQCCVALCHQLRARSVHVCELDYEHSSCLPELRARLLHRALSDPAQPSLMIAMDADCWLAPESIPDFAELVERCGHDGIPGGHALVGVLTPQRDNRVNAWEAPGQRLTAIPAPGYVFPIHAVGQAIAILDLRWYRGRGVGAGMFYAMAAAKMGDPTKVDQVPIFTGEDVWHCEAVRRLKGTVGAISLGARHAGG